MYSTELIRKFPEQPTIPIVYVVYNEDLISDAKFLIDTIWGSAYRESNVTVRALGDSDHYEFPSGVSIYLDPSVMVFRNNGYN